ncbi:MAG: ornithine cyclodeaminase family protein, partial [Candidatus Aminicenantes bacterium]|nr:ornithine cyclodeaminase family protein [Candidatus Aminicenantes bacterium]
MKPLIFDLDQIKISLKNLDPVKSIEEGFIAYSEGRTVIPPVGELLFKNPPGDAHIKYGYIHGDEYYVVKIASGFYENVKHGIPP